MKTFNIYEFKDNNKVYFIDNNKKDHILVRLGESVDFEFLKNEEVIYKAKKLDINYSTWCKLIGIELIKIII